MNNPAGFKDMLDRIMELSLRDKKTIQEKALKITEEGRKIK